MEARGNSSTLLATGSEDKSIDTSFTFTSNALGPSEDLRDDRMRPGTVSLLKTLDLSTEQSTAASFAGI